LKEAILKKTFKRKLKKDILEEKKHFGKKRHFEKRYFEEKRFQIRTSSDLA
jgi:hypothetical protein